MSKKILVDKKGLETYHNCIMNEYIKPLQDVSGIGGDGFNPRQEIADIKEDIETNIKSSISGLVGEDEQILSNLKSLGDRVGVLDKKINTMCIEEVLYEGSASAVGDSIVLSDDITKFIDVKAQFNFDGYVVEPFNISTSNLVIIRDFNLADSLTSTSTVSMYEMILNKIDNKTFKVKLNNKLNITPTTFSVTSSNASIMKITGRRIKK